MSFRDCIASARQQGTISQQQAEELLGRYERTLAQKRLELGDDAARAEAHRAMTAELRAEAIEERRITGLTIAARDRVTEALRGFRNAKGESDVYGAALGLIEHFGFHGHTSVDGRARAIAQMAMTEMEQALALFDRKLISGTRRNLARLDNVVSEAFGTGTGDAAAAAIAKAFGNVAETLRQRFNEAGGQIGKLADWGLPQVHDAGKMVKAGRETWKNFIRDKLDMQRMRDPLTDEAFAPARLDQFLDKVWARVITNGDIDVAPSAQRQGVGALYRQRAEERVLIFKNPTTWHDYQKAYGSGTAFDTMISHIHGMARDVAAMEVLGPNPAAMVEWMKQVVAQERAKAITGAPSLWNRESLLSMLGNNRERGQNRALDALDYNPGPVLDALWSQYRGGAVDNNKMASGFGAIRNIATSAFMGSTVVLAGATDPVTVNAAKKLAGIGHIHNYITEIARLFTADRKLGVHLSLGLDDAQHLMVKEARWAGATSGPYWSKVLADRMVTLTGLSPITQSRKHLLGQDAQMHYADSLKSDFASLPERDRRWLEGFGIRAAEWRLMQQAELYRPAGPDGPAYLRPHEIAAVPGQTKAREVAENYLHSIIALTERGVPTGTMYSRALVGNTDKGTPGSMMMQSFLQFKSFALSLTMNQIEAIRREVELGGRSGGARYAGGLFLGLTLMGALAMQVQAILGGADPDDMTKPDFWLRAAKKGGGAGLYGDFLLADVNRFGYSLAETVAGPTFSFLGDASKVVGRPVTGAAIGAAAGGFFGRRGALAGAGIGAAVGLLAHDGKSYKPAKAATDFARRWTPLANAFYTRLAWNRILMDQIELVTDPRAQQRWQAQRRKLREDKGSDFYWPRGQLTPDRAPTVPGLR